MGIHTDVGNCFRLAVEGTFEGQQIVNVFHYYKSEGTLEDADLVGFLNDFRDTVMPSYLGAITQPYVPTRLVATRPTGDRFTAELALSGTHGAIGGDAEVSQAAIIISWKTGYASRRYRGRTFMPAVPVAAITNGQLNGTGQPWYEAAANALMAVASSGVTYSLGVLSDPDRTLSVNPPTPTHTPPDVAQFADYTTHIIRTVPGIIRRRRIGQGS